MSMDENPQLGTDEHQQALRDLINLGFGGAIVNVCNTLQIDGGWLEHFVLDEMRADDRVE